MARNLNSDQENYLELSRDIESNTVTRLSSFENSLRIVW